MKLAAHSTSKVPDLTKVVSKDDSRPTLRCAYLDVDRQVLEATDSYRLASIAVEIEEDDVSGLVPAEALAALKKATKRGYPEPSLHCWKQVVVLRDERQGIRQEWTRPEGQFPNIPSLIPSEDVRHEFRVGLNAKMLADLAAGLGSEKDTVVLQFVQGAGNDPNPHRPILVSVPGHTDPESGAPVGLLMPVKVA